jgi:quercetin dioxygenase-like cupin family protein
MYYVLKGWATFEYEGIGVITVKPGDCVHQPPGIVHREIEHSDDLELLEVVLPADFKTRLVDAPTPAAAE